MMAFVLSWLSRVKLFGMSDCSRFSRHLSFLWPPSDVKPQLQQQTLLFSFVAAAGVLRAGQEPVGGGACQPLSALFQQVRGKWDLSAAVADLGTDRCVLG